MLLFTASENLCWVYQMYTMYRVSVRNNDFMVYTTACVVGWEVVVCVCMRVCVCVCVCVCVRTHAIEEYVLYCYKFMHKL